MTGLFAVTPHGDGVVSLRIADDAVHHLDPEWLDPFLSMVPRAACAAAAVRLPAREFLLEMFEAIEPALREEMDQQIRNTNKYQGTAELINGLEADAQSDLYSLGVLLHEMLTGARPYASNDLSQILVHQLKSPVPRLPEAVSRFQPLLDRLMAKERNDRFASVQEAITFMARSKLAA